MTQPYVISGIHNGQYTVTIDLQAWMCSQQILDFQKNVRNIGQEDPCFQSICSMYGSVLSYKSESLFPHDINCDPNKTKVLIILGNPATHSVANNMFFYSRNNGARHQFWGKLEKAGLMKKLKDRTGDRKAEAQERRDSILMGDTSEKYVVGLTTFYSMPTPVKPRNKNEQKQYPAKTTYGDASGVEALFQVALTDLRKMEYERITSYEFAQGAILIFTQLSTYLYVQQFSNNRYWAMSRMKKGSGGEDLKKIL